MGRSAEKEIIYKAFREAAEDNKAIICGMLGLWDLYNDHMEKSLKDGSWDAGCIYVPPVEDEEAEEDEEKPRRRRARFRQ